MLRIPYQHMVFAACCSLQMFTACNDHRDIIQQQNPGNTPPLTPVSTRCGDNYRDVEEVCDGTDLNNKTCLTQGFSGGALACSSACDAFITAACTGEVCSDGTDNDNDTLIDCADSDCAASCIDPCKTAQDIGAASSVQGTTEGSINVSDGTCQGLGGNDVVYKLTASQAGTYTFTLSSAVDLGMVVKNDCGASTQELLCNDKAGPGGQEKASYAMDAGDMVYVLISSYNSDSAGAFDMQVSFSDVLPESLCTDKTDNDNDTLVDCQDTDCASDAACAPVCGNTVKEGTEQCDDGNTQPGDGCSSQCQIEIVCGDNIKSGGETCDDGNTVEGDGCSPTCTVEYAETEPNNTAQTANLYNNTVRWIGRIDPSSDVDFITVTLTETSSTLRAAVHNTSSATECSMDTLLEIFAQDTTTRLALDDDSGPGYCSDVSKTALPAGTYYIRLGSYTRTPYDYQMDVTITPEWCGDRRVTGTEQCDDGNSTAMDGCSPTCTIEIICGDRVRGGAEECDDGNTVEGDGCSPTCQFEMQETESNDSVALANTYGETTREHWRGRIEPATDQDYVAVTLTANTSTLHAEITPVADSACYYMEIDSMLEIIAPDGTTVVAADDNGGVGNCSLVSAQGLAPGVYYIHTSATGSTLAGFMYDLAITIEPDICGDGERTGAEQCEDGNTLDGDSCDHTCHYELSETEPNNIFTQANPFSTEKTWISMIGPQGDQDWVSVVVPNNNSRLVVEVKDPGNSDCANYKISPELEIQNSEGYRLARDETSGIGNCPLITLEHLNAGTYYIRTASRTLTSTYAYVLSVQTGSYLCGDRQVTSDEECDDGNTLDGDGCNSACKVEFSEQEPNNTPGSANPFSTPWIARIQPGSDVDVVAITVEAPYKGFTASVQDMRPGDCSSMRIDTLMTLIGTDGTTELDEDDDGAEGFCSAITTEDLQPGTYYIEVRGYGGFSTFPYMLDVVLR
jgi:cysteine-rich repeat protein